MEESQYKLLVKRYFLYTAIPCSFLACCFALLCYIVDPLQFFHKSWFLPQDMLSWNMREQAAGIINNYDFDSIILGTSMLENTSASEAGEKLGGTFFNISMSGSDFYERSFPLEKAIRRNIKKIIYSLDGVYLNCNKGDPSYPTDNWSFLYDKNPINDILYYATKKYVTGMFAKKNVFKLRKVDLNFPNAWFNSHQNSRRFGGLNKWVENVDDPQVNNFLLEELPKVSVTTENNKKTVTHDLEMERNAREYIDTYLLKYVKDYPQTEFYCIFPPYFRYRYAQWLKMETKIFFLHQEVIRYMVEKTRTLPNLHVYGFEDQDFLDDIANYKDILHYHHRINSLMLDAIRAGDELTPDNVEQYLRISLEKAWKFDIGALNAEAQRLLREREAARKNRVSI